MVAVEGKLGLPFAELGPFHGLAVGGQLVGLSTHLDYRFVTEFLL